MLREVDRAGIQVTLSKGYNHLVDTRTGIIKDLYELKTYADDPDLFYYTGLLNNTLPYSPVKSNEINGGVALVRNNAKASAIGECVERYCAGVYNEADLVEASWKDIENDAVRPERFALFREEQYKTEGFEFTPFNDNTRIRWTWGYSLTNSRPVLIPASFVYVPYQFRNKEETINYPVSTGLACGNSLEEAVLSGIYEIAERDALMIMWHNRLPVPRIDHTSIDNPEIIEIIRRFTNSNVQIIINDATTDTGIYSIIALSVRRAKPCIAVGAAASLDPMRAISRALLEMGLDRYWLRQEMMNNPGYTPGEHFEDVYDLSRHGLIYGFPCMFPAIEFLVNSGEKKIHGMPDKSTGKVLGDINTCLTMLKMIHLEVIIKDITLPDIAEAGFSVVRVIIPGMQPLDISHNHRYLGGKRLYSVPKLLGYTEQETLPRDLNKFPHPFP